MNNYQIIYALGEINALTVNMKNDKGKKCKRFFEIIQSVRYCVDIIRELLMRIEKLETEINNTKQN